MHTSLQFRFATVADIAVLAPLNAQLLADEGNPNPLSLPELQARMLGWLSSKDYRALVFEADGQIAGYALYRHEPDHVYLRQFFVVPALRRSGVGKAALAWLWANDWQKAPCLRLELLSQNSAAQGFWRAVGLTDFYVTMEMKRPGQ